jgi:hypothetical protein
MLRLIVGQKFLSTTDRSFQEIIRENFVYADKTEYIYKLLKVDRFKSCFLSRPRRFGKTLLLKTIKALFQDDRKLFEGLLIDKSDYKFERHPVLNFNMAYAKIRTPDDLISNIEDDLWEMAAEHSVTVTSNSYGRMMEQLLKALSKKHGVGTVILVDEYDAPMTKHLSDVKLAEANRDVLHDFYQSIKTNVDYIHFAFVTGITRFAMTSLDSGPNNFKDISLLPEYAGICGFTPCELKTCFEDRFEVTLDALKDKGELQQNAGVDDLRAKILEWYDGYSWLGIDHVLNPYSILNFFEEKEFKSYWPSTGRPSHLSSLIRKDPLAFIQLSRDSSSARQIRKTELSNITLVPVMFHSGYLTIEKKTAITQIINNVKIEEEAFTFRTPNKEVASNSIESIFLDIFKPDDKNLSDLSENLPTALLNRNSDEVVRLLHDLLISISFHQHPPSRHDEANSGFESERVYHVILHASFLSAGFNVMSEASGGEGRSDITLFLNDDVYIVIELKCCALSRLSRVAWQDAAEKISADEKMREKEISAALDIAEDQIRKRDYAGPYRAMRHKVICMALAIRGRTDVAVRFVEV